MDIKTALSKVVDQLDLSTEEMQDVMRQIMTGQCKVKRSMRSLAPPWSCVSWQQVSPLMLSAW